MILRFRCIRTRAKTRTRAYAHREKSSGNHNPTEDIRVSAREDKAARISGELKIQSPSLRRAVLALHPSRLQRLSLCRKISSVPAAVSSIQTLARDFRGSCIRVYSFYFAGNSRLILIKSIH